MLLADQLITAPLAPTERSHDAVLMVVLLYLLLHSGLAVIFTALQAVRVRLGYTGSNCPMSPS